MKKKRFSAEQIVAILKKAEQGIPVAELARQVGVSEHAFYRWKNKYSGLEINQVQKVSSNVLVIRRWLDTSLGVMSVSVAERK